MRQSGLEQFEPTPAPQGVPQLMQETCSYHNAAHERDDNRIRRPVIQYSDGSYACWVCHSQNRRRHQEGQVHG